MARKCSICQRPERADIDKALAVDGEAYRSVAKRFQLSPSSVERHRRHLPEVSAELVCAASSAAASQALDVVTELRGLLLSAKADLEKVREGGDWKVSAQLYDKLTKQLELLGRFEGKLEKGGVTVNVQQVNNTSAAPMDLSPHELEVLARELAAEHLSPVELRELAAELELESAGVHLLESGAT